MEKLIPVIKVPDYHYSRNSLKITIRPYPFYGLERKIKRFKKPATDDHKDIISKYEINMSSISRMQSVGVRAERITRAKNLRQNPSRAFLFPNTNPCHLKRGIPYNFVDNPCFCHNSILYIKH